MLWLLHTTGGMSLPELVGDVAMAACGEKDHISHTSDDSGMATLSQSDERTITPSTCSQVGCRVTSVCVPVLCIVLRVYSSVMHNCISYALYTTVIITIVDNVLE